MTTPNSGQAGRDRDGSERREFIAAQRLLLDHHGVRAESHFVEVASTGGRAHVLVAGEGPPVMMVIGAGIVAGMWAPLLSHLAGFRLHAVDLPGHGLSDPARYRTDTLRATAVGFLDQVVEGLGLDRVPFIAQSMGGRFTTWLALDHPGRVSAISLVGCPAFMLGTSAPFPLRLSTLPPLRRLLERLQPPSPKQVDRLAAMVGEDLTDLPHLRRLLLAYERLPESSSQLLALHRAGVRIRGAQPEVRLDAAELARLTQPVQLIWGSNDTFGPPEVGRRAAEIIPDAEFHEVGGGHAPWFTQSEVMGPLVTAFLQRHGPTIPSTDHPPVGGRRA